jgi:hypothetical protein
VDLVLEVDLQPRKVQNPSRAEAFTSLYFLVSVQWHLGPRFYLRPGLGTQFRSWSGSDPVTSADAGGAIGLSAGYDLVLRPGFRLSPELFWRGAIIELEGNVGASLSGLSIVGRWAR